MADEIVTPDNVAHNAKNSELLYQNTSLLTTLIEISYEDYAKRANLDTQAFVVGIRELVTHLIKPICQQNDSTDYVTHLDIFNRYNCGDFIQYPAAIDRIAFALTHLVQLAIESFRALNYPQAYDRFLNLFESIFNNESIIQHNQHRNVLILMEQLRQKP